MTNEIVKAYIPRIRYRGFWTVFRDGLVRYRSQDLRLGGFPRRDWVARAITAHFDPVLRIRISIHAAERDGQTA